LHLPLRYKKRLTPPGHDALWTSLKSTFSDEAILELLLLAGFYRTVSYLTNALRLPAEPGSARFPDSVATPVDRPI